MLSSELPDCCSYGGQVSPACLVLREVQNFNTWTGGSAERKQGSKGLCLLISLWAQGVFLVPRWDAVIVLALLHTES